jgi:hypothetical protein
MCSAGAERGEFSAASRWPCAAIRQADVAVSSDNMSPGRDTEGHAAYSAGGTFNTGMLFIRANAQGQVELSLQPRNPHTSTHPRLQPCAIEAATPRVPPCHPAACPTLQPHRVSQAFAAAWHKNVAEPARGSRFYGDTSDQQVFNHMMRDPSFWPGISAPQGEHLMKTFFDKAGGQAKGSAASSFRLGALLMARPSP